MSLDFKETFIAEISTSIGTIKTVLENLQVILNKLPDTQYHDYCKEKVNELYIEINKLNSELVRHNNKISIEINLLKKFDDILTRFNQLITKYDLDKLWDEQQDVQQMLLNSASCNEADNIILDRNSELARILFLLQQEDLKIRDVREWAQYIKRSNQFYRMFSGWKKVLIIVGGAILFILTTYKDFIGVIKSLMPIFENLIY